MGPTFGRARTSKRKTIQGQTGEKSQRKVGGFVDPGAGLARSTKTRKRKLKGKRKSPAPGAGRQRKTMVPWRKDPVLGKRSVGGDGEPCKSRDEGEEKSPGGKRGGAGGHWGGGCSSRKVAQKKTRTSGKKKKKKEDGNEDRVTKVLKRGNSRPEGRPHGGARGGELGTKKFCRLQRTTATASGKPGSGVEKGLGWVETGRELLGLKKVKSVKGVEEQDALGTTPKGKGKLQRVRNLFKGGNWCWGETKEIGARKKTAETSCKGAASPTRFRQISNPTSPLL